MKTAAATVAVGVAAAEFAVVVAAAEFEADTAAVAAAVAAAAVDDSAPRELPHAAVFGATRVLFAETGLRHEHPVNERIHFRHPPYPWFALGHAAVALGVYYQACCRQSSFERERRPPPAPISRGLDDCTHSWPYNNCHHFYRAY